MNATKLKETYSNNYCNFNVIKKLFPSISNSNNNTNNNNNINLINLKMDDVGKYSISLPKTANLITKIIKHHIEKNDNLNLNKLIITDATAGIGGNTISFANNFFKVNAIEINKKRFDFLKNNINVYNFENVEIINSDYIKIMKTLNQDIVFIDPPWGGRNYKNINLLNINLSGKSLESICQEMKHKTKLLVLKVPLNYNIKGMIKNINANIYQYKIKKMFIVVVEY